MCSADFRRTKNVAAWARVMVRYYCQIECGQVLVTHVWSEAESQICLCRIMVRLDCIDRRVDRFAKVVSAVLVAFQGVRVDGESDVLCVKARQAGRRAQISGVERALYELDRQSIKHSPDQTHSLNHSSNFALSSRSISAKVAPPPMSPSARTERQRARSRAMWVSCTWPAT